MATLVLAAIYLLAVHSRGDTVTKVCDEAFECAYESEVTCSGTSQNDTCIVSCSGSQSCLASTVVCPDTGDCQVKCSGSRACEDVSIQCPTNGNCIVDCEASSACKETRIAESAQSGYVTNITCSGSQACNQAIWNCTASDTCNLNCKSGSNACAFSSVYCPNSGAPGQECNVQCVTGSTICENIEISCKDTASCNLNCNNETGVVTGTPICWSAKQFCDSTGSNCHLTGEVVGASYISQIAYSSTACSAYTGDGDHLTSLINGVTNAPYDWTYTTECDPCKSIIFDGKTRYVSAWSGTFCDDAKVSPSQKVTEIRFKNRGFSGPLNVSYIPSDVTYADFSSNSFYGEISWTSLSNQLTDLFLSNNFFSGSLDLTNFPSNLEQFDAQSNEFSGTLDFGSLNHGLTTLNLAKNNFSGSVDITNLATTLTKLDLGYNSFSGGFDFDTFTLSEQLTQVKLNDNQFSGRLDISAIANSSVSLLYVQNNEFTGGNTALKAFPKTLTDVDMSNNKFSAAVNVIISALNEATGLTDLDLSNNELTGIVRLEKLPSRCETLDVSYNKITGLALHVNDTLAAASQLTTFDASHNNITSTIDIGDIGHSVTEFDVSYNEIMGTLDFSSVPSSVTKLTLNNNRFNGSVGSLSGLQSGITHIYMTNNDLEGPVSFEGLPSTISRIEMDISVYCAASDYYYYYDTNESNSCQLPIGPDRKRTYCSSESNCLSSCLWTACDAPTEFPTEEPTLKPTNAPTEFSTNTTYASINTSNTYTGSDGYTHVATLTNRWELIGIVNDIDTSKLSFYKNEECDFDGETDSCYRWICYSCDSDYYLVDSWTSSKVKIHNAYNSDDGIFTSTLAINLDSSTLCEDDDGFSDILSPGSTYEFGFIGIGKTIADDEQIEFKSNISIYINEPPASGTCDVSPKNGYALETDFVITCSDWDDDNTGTDDLIYNLWKTDAHTTAFSSWQSSSVMSTTFGYGGPYYVEAIIMDEYDAFSCVLLTFNSTLSASYNYSDLLDGYNTSSVTDVVNLVVDVTSVLEASELTVSAEVELTESMLSLLDDSEISTVAEGISVISAVADLLSILDLNRGDDNSNYSSLVASAIQVTAETLDDIYVIYVETSFSEDALTTDDYYTIFDTLAIILEVRSYIEESTETSNEYGDLFQEMIGVASQLITNGKFDGESFYYISDNSYLEVSGSRFDFETNDDDYASLSYSHVCGNVSNVDVGYDYLVQFANDNSDFNDRLDCFTSKSFVDFYFAYDNYDTDEFGSDWRLVDIAIPLEDSSSTRRMNRRRMAVTQDSSLDSYSYSSVIAINSSTTIEDSCDPIIMQFIHDDSEWWEKTEENNTYPVCVWYDTDNDEWSTEGCYVLSHNYTSTKCACTHMTYYGLTWEYWEAEALIIKSAESLDSINDMISENPTGLVIVLCLFLFLIVGWILCNPYCCREWHDSKPLLAHEEAIMREFADEKFEKTQDGKERKIIRNPHFGACTKVQRLWFLHIFHSNLMCQLCCWHEHSNFSNAKRIAVFTTYMVTVFALCAFYYGSLDSNLYLGELWFIIVASFVCMIPALQLEYIWRNSEPKERSMDWNKKAQALDFIKAKSKSIATGVDSEEDDAPFDNPLKRKKADQPGSVNPYADEEHIKADNVNKSDKEVEMENMQHRMSQQMQEMQMQVQQMHMQNQMLASQLQSQMPSQMPSQMAYNANSLLQQPTYGTGMATMATGTNKLNKNLEGALQSQDTFSRLPELPSGAGGVDGEGNAETGEYEAQRMGHSIGGANIETPNDDNVTAGLYNDHDSDVDSSDSDALVGSGITSPGGGTSAGGPSAGGPGPSQQSNNAPRPMESDQVERVHSLRTDDIMETGVNPDTLVKARQLNLKHVASDESNIEATNSIRQSLLKHHYRLCHGCKLFAWISFFVWFIAMCLVIFFYSLYWESSAALDESYLYSKDCNATGYLDVSEKEWLVYNVTVSEWGDGESLYGYSDSDNKLGLSFASTNLFENMSSNTIRWFISCVLVFIITLCVIQPLYFCCVACVKFCRFEHKLDQGYYFDKDEDILVGSGSPEAEDDEQEQQIR